jgi:hypothetical protein
MILRREVLKQELMRKGIFEINGKPLQECSVWEMEWELNRIMQEDGKKGDEEK